MISSDSLHKQAFSLPRPTLPSSFDMRRVLAGVNSYLNPARDSFILHHHVSKVQDGFVYVSFALPEGMLSCFVNFLQSMASFFNIVNIKAKSVAAQHRELSLDELAQREKIKSERERIVCSKYDKYISQGCSVNEAISLTNSYLKDKNPWATYEIVKSILRSTGRFRKNCIKKP